MMAITIASIEYTIIGNNITEVQSIDTTGQVMALVTGAGMLLALLGQWTMAWYGGTLVSPPLVLVPTLSYQIH